MCPGRGERCARSHARAIARDASEGKGPQRRAQQRLGRRLEEVTKAVGGGYCRLQMPLRLALGVRGTVAGRRLGRPGGGGGDLPPLQCIAGRGPVMPLDCPGNSWFLVDPVGQGAALCRSRRSSGPEARAVAFGAVRVACPQALCCVTPPSSCVPRRTMTRRSIRLRCTRRARPFAAPRTTGRCTACRFRAMEVCRSAHPRRIPVHGPLPNARPPLPPQMWCAMCSPRGLHWGRTVRCAKSRLFSITGRHGSQGFGICTPRPPPPCWYTRGFVSVRCLPRVPGF